MASGTFIATHSSFHIAPTSEMTGFSHSNIRLCLAIANPMLKRGQQQSNRKTHAPMQYGYYTTKFYRMSVLMLSM
jgi:hypothetical protein